MTSKEVLEKLYEEREYAYADKVNHKDITWSNDIAHYDIIGRCLNAIRKDLEILELIKERLHHDIFGNIQFVDKPTERIDENGNKILIDDGKYKIMEWIDNEK